MAKSKSKKVEKDLLPAGEYDPSLAKVRISILIPGDILNAYKAQADKTGQKYQILMNRVLREYVKSSLSEEMKKEIRKIVREELKLAS